MAKISLEDLKIQLVEPSAMQAEVVRRMLAETGVTRVHHFADAGAALAEMQALKPDAVISALYLPDMTGIELVAAMRADENLEWVPFILISSETRPQVLNPVRQSGACCIINKPFTAEQMKRALYAVVDQLEGIAEIDGEDVEDLKVLLVDDSAMSRR
ncbi:MAG: response regulator, partial [Azoarcus sp.]|nr:response regulator [Azoarcus sp.]